jgi:hypothetical protein
MKLILVILCSIFVACTTFTPQTSNIHREGTEWCEIWIPQANEERLPRVLLIGDSITNAYYPLVSKNLQDKATVIKFTTSASVADSAFQFQLESVLTNYRYEVIHLNNGLHGFKYTEEEYLKGYNKVLKIISEKAPDAKIIITLSTPLQSTSELNHLNPRIELRNKSVENLAKKHNLIIDNLYKLSVGKPELYRDPYHYKPDGVKLQSTQVTQVINELL